jgi:hypothetical protein
MKMVTEISVCSPCKGSTRLSLRARFSSLSDWERLRVFFIGTEHKKFTMPILVRFPHFAIF